MRNTLLLACLSIVLTTAPRGQEAVAPDLSGLSALVDPVRDPLRVLDLARVARRLEDGPRRAVLGEIAEHGVELRARIRAVFPELSDERIDATLRESSPPFAVLRAVASAMRLLEYGPEPDVDVLRADLAGADACRRDAAVWLLRDRPELAPPLRAELETLFAREAWEDVEQPLAAGPGPVVYGRPWNVAYRVPLAHLLVANPEVDDSLYEHAILQLFDAGMLAEPPTRAQRIHPLERLQVRRLDTARVRLRILDVLDGKDAGLQTLALPVFEGFAVVPVDERVSPVRIRDCMPIRNDGDPLERDAARDLVGWRKASDLQVLGVLARRVRQTEDPAERERWRRLFAAWK